MDQNRSLQHLGVVQEKLTNIVLALKCIKALFPRFFSSDNAVEVAKEVKVFSQDTRVKVSMDFECNSTFFQQGKGLTRF